MYVNIDNIQQKVYIIITETQKKERYKEMYEVVKTVKGYDIVRMKGTKGAYHVNVNVREGKGFREFHTFKTIKAAVEFIETVL